MSKRALLAVLLAVAVIVGLILPGLLGTDHPVLSEAWVRSRVAGLGMAGPLALIGLMVLAIVASPIPSGPIAVAAGALYGTLWGAYSGTLGHPFRQHPATCSDTFGHL